jgi:hypothetical protein
MSGKLWKEMNKREKFLGILSCFWWALCHMPEAAMEGERMKRRCPQCGYEKPARGCLGPG